MIKQLRVVWICHFSNSEINEFLSPSRKVNEMSPWITYLTRLFEGKDHIEIHIISPHLNIKVNKQFELRGLHYHFFNAHIPFWGRPWPCFFKFDYWTNFYNTKRKVRNIVNRIHPDIIHLHGAENAYYSSSIIQFKKKYPIIVTVQGFVSFTFETKTFLLRKRIETEQKILRELTHFGYRTKKMGCDIRRFNPNAILHWHQYPIHKVKLYQVKKKFDIVFFARISRDKGIEDLLKALDIIKKRSQDVSLIVIGNGSKSYLKYLKEKCVEYNIVNNVSWAGFLPTQDDVHRLVSMAKISVLPTYHDIVPGTIIESMFLQVPVVAYGVGGIPELNANDEIIKIVEKNNIEKLATEIMSLIESKENRDIIVKKAYKKANEIYNNTRIYTDLLNIYRTVMVDD